MKCVAIQAGRRRRMAGRAANGAKDQTGEADAAGVEITSRGGRCSGKMPPMLLLALETSTDAGSCALWRDGVLTERTCPTGRSHSETLLPLVRELLDAAGVTVAELDAIAFGVGPGAFTGLRVACGAAQGLAVANNIPLVPITSLETLAALSGRDQVVALLDARMGEVYSATFVRQNARWVRTSEIQLGAPDRVALPSDGTWSACGNAMAVYPALAERLLESGIADLIKAVPLAATLAELAVAALGRGETIDAAEAAPLYVRDKVAKTVAERLSEGGRA